MKTFSPANPIRFTFLLLACLSSTGCMTHYRVKPGSSQGHVTSEAAREKALNQPRAAIKKLVTVRNGTTLTTGETAIDLNRAGVPLAEIVTEVKTT